MNIKPTDQLSLPEVLQITRIKKSALYARISKQLFPKQRHIAGTKAVYWSGQDILEWMQSNGLPVDEAHAA